jgi:hypothetical protein
MATYRLDAATPLAASRFTPSFVRKQQRLFSAYCGSTDWTKACRLFQEDGDGLVRLATMLPVEQLARRVPVDGRWGTDAVSCAWSADMVLEHLIDQGVMYAQIIVHLSRGEQPWQDVDVSDSAPHVSRGTESICAFAVFLKDFAEVLAQDVGDPNSPATSRHPQYGDLTAKSWLSLAAFHQAMHRRQMERIVASLE